MPKPTTRLQRRARRRRRPLRRRKKMSLSKLVYGFPRTYTCKLRYVDEVILNPGLAGLDETAFRANGAFDPYQPIGGHQPYWWDQLAAVYDIYTVIGAKITVSFAPDISTNVNPGYFGVMASGESALPAFSSVAQLLEARGNRAGMAGALMTQSQPNSVSTSFSPKRWFGLKSLPSGGAYSGYTGGLTTGTTPTKECYFNVWSASAGGNDPGQMNFKVVIEYIVRFSDVITNIGS